MSEKSDPEKRGEFTGWSDDVQEAPPLYQRQYSPPRGPPPSSQNPSHQPNAYSDDKGHSTGSRGLADSYYGPSPGAPNNSYTNDYASGSAPRPSYGGPEYVGLSQSQSPPQGYYPSPSGYSQGGSPQPADISLGQQFPGFTYTGKAPSKRDPLDPPPPSFSRQPNPQCPYPRLPEPVQIPAKDKSTLDKGFIPIFPAPQLLMAHDVQPADVSRLLEDCHLMSGVSMGQKIMANVAPLAMGVGFLPGMFITRGLEGRMKHGHIDDVTGLVDVWDSAFFAPRRLRLSMQRGRASYDDGGDDYSSDSDSSSDDDRRRRRSYEDIYGGRAQAGFGRFGGGTTGLLSGRMGLMGGRMGLADARMGIVEERMAMGGGLGGLGGGRMGFGGGRVGLEGGRAGLGFGGGLGGGLLGLAGGSRISMREERRAEKQAYRDERRAERRAGKAERRAERRARREVRRAARRGVGVGVSVDERIYLVISNR